MKITFDCHGNDKQKQAFIYWADKTTEEIVYGGSKGSAKSYTGAALIFGDALLYPGTHYFIARKSLNDLRKFTTPTIHELFDNWGLNKKGYLDYNGMDNYFTLPNQSRVYYLDAKYIPSDPNYTRFGSMQFTRGMIEEAGEFEKECKNNLFISCGRWKNKEYNLIRKLIQTCNPSKNYLYFDHYKKDKEGTLPEWSKFIQALPQDNRMLPPEYIEGLHKTLTGGQKERLLFGNWEWDDDPYTLMEYDAICDLWTNQIEDTKINFITCDVARFGDDRTVIMIWNGLKVVKIITYDKSGINTLVDKIKQLQKEYNVRSSNIVIDSDGVGGGLADMLQGCKHFVNNQRAIGNYQNIKTECYYKLSDMVNGGLIAIIPQDHKEQIIQELEVVKAINTDKDTKQQIISKDTIKEKIGRSPDFSDAMMMRMYYEVKPKHKAVIKRIR